MSKCARAHALSPYSPIGSSSEHKQSAVVQEGSSSVSFNVILIPEFVMKILLLLSTVCVCVCVSLVGCSWLFSSLQICLHRTNITANRRTELNVNKPQMPFSALNDSLIFCFLCFFKLLTVVTTII